MGPEGTERPADREKYRNFKVHTERVEKKISGHSGHIKKSKEIADTEVENALYLKCIGHKVQLKKTFKVRKIEYNDSGRKIKEEEHLEVGEDEVYIPPDTKAIIFWLTNRAREDWRERQNIQEEQEETEESGVIMLRRRMWKE